ncbi:uncharacterized protein BX663DRAFT_504820 [Cokeromyces recurvatus]|uniref:uncharacterized protein n=1 Tax=Cokeromyces recurvatus TaxID=90255 RepID=UPI00221EB4B8|nr:uncharacterized protein BX663DRAFT_504820 [Cokeromyces recurvatus]KAI7904363.1 hypothetical protein BX663DRAFT_504820 [Cokeromyces recurvatus]
MVQTFEHLLIMEELFITSSIQEVSASYQRDLYYGCYILCACFRESYYGPSSFLCQMLLQGGFLSYFFCSILMNHSNIDILRSRDVFLANKTFYVLLYS